MPLKVDESLQQPNEIRLLIAQSTCRCHRRSTHRLMALNQFHLKWKFYSATL